MPEAMENPNARSRRKRPQKAFASVWFLVIDSTIALTFVGACLEVQTSDVSSTLSRQPFLPRSWNACLQQISTALALSCFRPYTSSLLVYFADGVSTAPIRTSWLRRGYHSCSFQASFMGNLWPLAKLPVVFVFAYCCKRASSRLRWRALTQSHLDLKCLSHTTNIETETGRRAGKRTLQAQGKHMVSNR